ncbi:glutamyl-tRNA amidotransferase subunit A [Chaetomium tenue]|uniref:Glutamyl-tRNA amidotransferase subunit A n=1 Tax=Chaetomium tenue TaxID=1854479 RepID=A0ACB7PK17_9PEZI|nr:glutamyl-tRNA amidotransferase subunit A [Chaetomium globosum]
MNPTLDELTPGLGDLPPLLHLTIKETADGLQSGRFTTVDLAKAYLARIDEASAFKAVLQINPDALSVAQRLDEERTRSGSRGPLHGIPILVKDNIATSDNLDVSAGSYALLGAKPSAESSVISKLRDAGVLILGKTNMSEWANFRGLNISSGWSPRGGQTLGAYYPGSTPEGSSSGSAVAAALGLSAAAIGTETFGSILEPAELNNVVGLKPSRGLVANDGAIPISSRQDVIGTLTRTVKDAAYLLTTMAGRSEKDKGTWNIPFENIPDFTTHCKGTDLSGITIGVPRNAFTADPMSPIMLSFESALKTLGSAGATVVDSADFPEADGFKKLNQQVRGIVRSSEFKRDVVHYLGTLETNPNNLHTAEDIIEFTKSFPAEEYPDRDIGKFLWTQAEGIDVNSDKYKEMVKQEQFYGGEGGILGAMEKHGLDLLVVPSSLGIANDLAAKMGFPVLGVPLGFYPKGTPIELDDSKPNLVRVAPGIPYSLTLISKAFSDGILIQVAHAFEQLSGVRQNGPLPFQLPATELGDVQTGALET